VIVIFRDVSVSAVEMAKDGEEREFAGTVTELGTVTIVGSLLVRTTSIPP
jgi:hypothetical protein